MGFGKGECLRAICSSDSIVGHSFCARASRSHRFKSSKSTVHLNENQLGGLGKESKSQLAHLSSNLTANHAAVAQKPPPERSQSKVSDFSDYALLAVSERINDVTIMERSTIKTSLCRGQTVEPISSADRKGLSNWPAESLSHTHASVPNWTSFQQNLAVKKFLAHLVSLQTFSLSGVKRAMHVYLMETNSNQQHLGMFKPNGLHIKEIFDPRMCQSGEEPLSLSRQPLKVKIADQHHIASCNLCSVTNSVNSKCYFSKLRLCLTHGWRPAIDRENIREEFKTSGNYPSVAKFQVTAMKEFDKMCDSGALEKNPEGSNGIVTPLGAVIKNSDKQRAKVLTGISITDQKSLSSANVRLEDLGYPAIKARLTTDVTATGVNRAAYVPPFSYPGLADGIHIITPNCYLAKADVARYFLMFPLSTCSYYLFLVRWLGALYTYVRCMFGLASCPYYCSIWSAEFRAWVLSQGIPCAHMMDDWLTRGTTYEEAKKNLCAIMAIMISIGLSFGADKEEISQQPVFLGVLLNTITMKMSFEKTGAQAFLVHLVDCQKTLVEGGCLSHTVIRSTAGKLNWYAEVLQSGRLHIRSWWCLLRYGKNLDAKLQRTLLIDTEWWIFIIDKWAAGVESNLEYPILSASVLLNDPKSIYVVQSDISGIDGLGYYHGFLRDENPKFLSRTWSDYDQSVSPAISSSSAVSMLYTTSHDSELKGLAHFLQSTTVTNAMLIWVTDSLSGAWSLNKGRCKEEAGLLTLAYILSRADELKLLLVALWVPRDLNQTADYLSHLAVYLNRSEVSGRIKDLSSPELRPNSNAIVDYMAEAGRAGEASIAKEECASDGSQGIHVPKMVCPRGPPSEPAKLHERRGLRGGPRDQEQRLDQISGPGDPRSQVGKRSERSMARCHRRQETEDPREGAPIRRCVSWEPEASSPKISPSRGNQEITKAHRPPPSRSVAPFHQS